MGRNKRKRLGVNGQMIFHNYQCLKYFFTLTSRDWFIQFSIFILHKKRLVAVGGGIEAVGADALLGESDSLAYIVDGVELKCVDTDVLTDDLDHVGILFGFGILVKSQLLLRQLGGRRSLKFLYDSTGDEFTVGL